MLPLLRHGLAVRPSADVRTTAARHRLQAMQRIGEGDSDMIEFEWPCDRRVAHEPHNAYTDSSPSEFCPVCGRERGQEHARSDCDGICPGVRAHPHTVIGGNYA